MTSNGSRLTSFRFRAAYATDVGNVRDTNQDHFLIQDPLFAVADGMGGHRGGETASATALEALSDNFVQDGSATQLRLAIQTANTKVFQKSQFDSSLHGMGTTLTGIATVRDAEGLPILAVFNVGDSRTYCLRDGELTQLTRDHSFVEEMIQAGELTAEEAETHPRRNVLTRALGVEPDVPADVREILPRRGDRYLICSDGLTKELTEDVISATLRNLRSPHESATELVRLAKKSGGHDNITIVIADLSGTSQHEEELVKEQEKPNIETTDEKTPKRASYVSMTTRITAFLVAVGLLLGLGYYAVHWYARSSYFVRADENVLVGYRGQPEKILWFNPTRDRVFSVTTDQVPEYALPELQSGKRVGSRAAAEAYVQALVEQRQSFVGTTTIAPPPESTPETTPDGAEAPPTTPATPPTAPPATQVTPPRAQ